MAAEGLLRDNPNPRRDRDQDSTGRKPVPLYRLCKDHQIRTNCRSGEQTMNVKTKNSIVGTPVPLVDGIEKVTGKALYTADLDTRDALVGRILRAPVSHGRIIR